ncbi:MAG: hypothetical protein CMG62_07840 [Candidatus Marinimicrobia bacterium]|nr:hypothetical protein [Candidatus Neomarinimicrobiota bacterium]
MLFKYIKNTIQRLCPSCGKESLFDSWTKMKEKCNNCGIPFIQNSDSHWFFLLIIDRGLFIFPIVLGFYLNIKPMILIYLSLSLLVIFIIATPIRLAISLAFEFYLRNKLENN